MDPQDVPRLFNCTAHTTALTPENLWDRHVETKRELSFLDPENLDKKESSYELNPTTEQEDSIQIGFGTLLNILIDCHLLLSTHSLDPCL